MDFEINSIFFSSNFDSGNLAVVKQVSNFKNGGEKNHSEDFDMEFDLWTNPDAAGSCNENRNRSWFYFSVKGSLIGKTIKFNIQNLNKLTSLFIQGMRPVFKIVPSRKSKWQKIIHKPTFQFVDSHFKLSFLHQFGSSIEKDTVVYFAFCYPFSYTECQDYLDDLDKKYSGNKIPDIYFHRDTLCFSNDGLKVDLLTVSSMSGITLEHENNILNNFSSSEENLNQHSLLFKGKKVFFLSSRVHPGETPASFIFNGFLNFILSSDDERARVLRNLFVFKMIPMLNPDGVKRGYYRSDSLGVNLNRTYDNPDPILQPSIYAVKKLLSYYHRLEMCDETLFKNKSKRRSFCSLPVISQSRANSDDAKNLSCIMKDLPVSFHKKIPSSVYSNHLKRCETLSCVTRDAVKTPKGISIYVDLHAHACKRGCFIYGNHFANYYDQVECMLLPKLLSLNCPYFDFEACNFSYKNMYQRDDKDGLSKEGSGRVAIFKMLGIVHCYTLECNYNSGKLTNKIIASTGDKGQAAAAISGSTTYYTPEHFYEVGRCLAIAALDINSKKPWSRLPFSEFNTVDAVRKWLLKFLRQERRESEKNTWI